MIVGSYLAVWVAIGGLGHDKVTCGMVFVCIFALLGVNGLDSKVSG